ncbi:putative toxin biosynthesis protein Tri7-like protein [Paecilomyces variotii]|uniref:Putative toxin biosynthesis protein Tri7-like protein n=1 Tax=Byssochlamys spectabilis TaxID=264951 RepID=A0A443HHP8_BYSSP|nr:putative toxin biosynthesis protein Tri7-like protein [Paecilomyces variotii]KAJ9202660.1 hypothetical protein DTO032I3_3476 [Paecilomyces variotii]KAJ9276862.1 hypothetical protein DTO021D3_6299 [Paecilomyces variotii]KAJ9340885.1 hypothetical protein DTO027B6_6572 [Paecilomyces variotii]KAJ9358457.1 hypothetical protein DTO280E4_5216 [Paecilomyces variotii]KAJ9380736.1 hypothetical protein DTO032I4_6557 [Paecilomyces variotii]
MAIDLSPCATFLYTVLASHLTATLIATTPRKSLFRILGNFILCFIAYKQWTNIPNIPGSDTVRGMVAASVVISLLYATNLLFMTGIDLNDLIREKLADPLSMGLRARIDAALKIVQNTRGIGTSWQVKGTPCHPAFYEPNRRSPDRGVYVLRQMVILIWQYLLLDAVTVPLKLMSVEDRAREMGPGTEWLFWNASPEQWTRKFKTGVIGWFVIARLIIDSNHRLFSIVAVGLGGSPPELWPPFFGSMWDAYTIRGFWGTFWHQSLRWILTSWSSLITRTILRLPRPSLVERYLNILLAFSVSGLIHVAYDIGSNVPLERSGAMHFFCSFAFGIMLEDAVQEAWKRLTGNRTGKSGETSIWKKFVGFVWVAVFLSVVTPFYAYPSLQVPKAAVPYSIAEKAGITPTLSAAVVGMLITKFWLGGEE